MGKVYPKYPKNRELLRKHGWTRQLIHPFKESMICKDAFNPNMYYWTQGQAPSLLASVRDMCTTIHKSGYCRRQQSMQNWLQMKTGSSTLLNNLNTDAFAKLFCQKTCGFSHPGCDHQAYQKEKTNKESEHKVVINDARMTNKNNECNAKNGLKGSGTQVGVGTIIGITVDMSPFTPASSIPGQTGCYAMNILSSTGGSGSTYVGGGLCASIPDPQNQMFAVPLVGFMKQRRRRNAWNTPGCLSQCQQSGQCYGYNGYYNYNRRRAGRPICLLWGNGAGNCGFIAPLPARI